MSQERFDLAIVGAGPVGALTALLAAEQGFRVVLLDAAPEPTAVMPDGEYDLRVVAVSPGSRGLFERVKAWPVALDSRIQPYQRMRVWDGDGQGNIEFDAGTLGRDALGQIVEVRVLQWGLDQALAEHVNVTRWSAAKFQHMQVSATGTVLHCADGRQLEATVVVGADGRDSRVRAASGIGIEARDYAQSGVVAVLDAQPAICDSARQVFTATGPLGLLPLPQGQVSIVWSVATAEAQRLCALDEQAFCAELQHVVADQHFRLRSRRVSFPLMLQHATHYAQDRSVLVGDAAHVVHPLAGLGMNLGFEDAAALVASLDNPRLLRSQRAAEAALAQYARTRRRQVLPALGLIDGLDALFGSRSAELMRLRGGGLSVVNTRQRLKSEFMAYALGGSSAAA